MGNDCVPRYDTDCHRLGVPSHREMALDRGVVVRTIEFVLARVPPAEMRLVGTSSSLVRGIPIQADDIDILFRTRSDIDAWCAQLQSTTAAVTYPEWLADGRQYFARLILDGVIIELSTVEAPSRDDTMECVGIGPWAHFDSVTCGGVIVQATASELRLLSELERNRRDRAVPILGVLKKKGCDIDLVRRGLNRMAADTVVFHEVLSELIGSG